MKNFIIVLVMSIGLQASQQAALVPASHARTYSNNSELALDEMPVASLASLPRFDQAFNPEAKMRAFLAYCTGVGADSDSDAETTILEMPADNFAGFRNCVLSHLPTIIHSDNTERFSFSESTQQSDFMFQMMNALRGLDESEKTLVKMYLLEQRAKHRKEKYLKEKEKNLRLSDALRMQREETASYASQVDAQSKVLQRPVATAILNTIGAQPTDKNHQTLRGVADVARRTAALAAGPVVGATSSVQAVVQYVVGDTRDDVQSPGCIVQ